jgi:hypothetical protein
VLAVQHVLQLRVEVCVKHLEATSSELNRQHVAWTTGGVACSLAASRDSCAGRRECRRVTAEGWKVSRFTPQRCVCIEHTIVVVRRGQRWLLCRGQGRLRVGHTVGPLLDLHASHSGASKQPLATLSSPVISSFRSATCTHI